MDGNVVRLPCGQVLLALLVVVTTPVRAQAPPRTQAILDLVYGSRAFWRGTPRVSNPVMQAAGTIAFEALGGQVSAGVWALWEWHTPEGDEFSIAGPGSGLAEADWSLRYARRGTTLDLLGGITHYRLDNDSAFVVGRNSAGQSLGTLEPFFNTTEVYAAVFLREGVLRSIGFTPALSVWYDVAKVDGAYAELELGYALPVVPLEKPVGVGIHLSVKSGMSLGQSTKNGTASGYYEGDGFTHIDIAATTTVQFSPGLGWGFTYRRTFGFDPATKGADPSSSAWGWIETWLTARLPGRLW